MQHDQLAQQRRLARAADADDGEGLGAPNVEIERIVDEMRAEARPPASE